jgi:hypothetical protein
MKHPFCSPDLAPNGFWLFPNIKSALKRRRFQDIKDIKKMWQHWKLFHNRSSKNVSNNGSITGLGGIAAQGEHFECDPSHWAVSTLTLILFRELQSHTS